jgi:hypothetical protein
MVALQIRHLQAHEIGRRSRSPGILSVFLLIPLFMVGCTAGQYGQLQRDSHVTQMFNSGSVPNSYRFYTIGRSDLPYAIIGIAPDYHLVLDDWDPVEPNTRAFARKVRAIWIPQTWDRLESGQGARILDRQGNQIGIWYSMYPHTVIKVLTDHRVEIFSPFTPTNGAHLK